MAEFEWAIAKIDDDKFLPSLRKIMLSENASRRRQPAVRNGHSWQKITARLIFGVLQVPRRSKSSPASGSEETL
jgi:hypothetical protein